MLLIPLITTTTITYNALYWPSLILGAAVQEPAEEKSWWVFGFWFFFFETNLASDFVHSSLFISTFSLQLKCHKQTQSLWIRFYFIFIINSYVIETLATHISLLRIVVVVSSINSLLCGCMAPLSEKLYALRFRENLKKN